jgi:hypothetical protein
MANKTTQEKRSPLRQKPLRNPGESLQVERQNLLVEEFLPCVALATVVALFAAYEWIRWSFALPPQPLLVTTLALLLTGYAAYQFVTLRKRLKALKLGLEGEKAVGQYLEDLRSQGCRVFHDIVGNGFNIDHVVVSPHGIFVIETKTYSKPRRREARVEFDGNEYWSTESNRSATR